MRGAPRVEIERREPAFCGLSWAGGMAPALGSAPTGLYHLGGLLRQQQPAAHQRLDRLDDRGAARSAGRVPIVVLVFLMLTLLLLREWGSSYVDATTARHVLRAAWRRETASVAAQRRGRQRAAALGGTCGPAHLAVQLNATSAELNLYNFYRIADAEIAAATAAARWCPTRARDSVERHVRRVARGGAGARGRRGGRRALGERRRLRRARGVGGRGPGDRRGLRLWAVGARRPTSAPVPEGVQLVLVERQLVYTHTNAAFMVTVIAAASSSSPSPSCSATASSSASTAQR